MNLETYLSMKESMLSNVPYEVMPGQLEEECHASKQVELSVRGYKRDRQVAPEVQTINYKPRVDPRNEILDLKETYNTLDPPVEYKGGSLVSEIRHESDHIVPQQLCEQHTPQYYDIPKSTEVASDHERFLHEMVHGAAEFSAQRIESKNETEELNDQMDNKRDTDSANSSYEIKQSHHLTSFADFTHSFETVPESRDDLDQLLTRLMNKSYDEINVKLEADILTVEVNETSDIVDVDDVIVDVREEHSMTSEEMTLIDLCEWRKFNHAARSRSVDDSVLCASTKQRKLAKASSCLQLWLGNREKTHMPSVKKVDLLVSHFTMPSLNKHTTDKPTVSVSSGQVRSQTFTQSLNTILGCKQTKSVSFAMDIENIDSPKRASTTETGKKSKSGNKKSKSCCID
uniref:Uncharacterized protein n=1 Tax=Cacopsylla melanoneura TaxID=428564 RepID=A0A8D8YC67_9HEMI